MEGAEQTRSLIFLTNWLPILIFRRGSSSATDLNTTASTSDTGSEWGSGSDDGQEPDVERTTALINGELFAYHYQRHVTVMIRSLHMMP